MKRFIFLLFAVSLLFTTTIANDVGNLQTDVPGYTVQLDQPVYFSQAVMFESPDVFQVFTCSRISAGESMMVVCQYQPPAFVYPDYGLCSLTDQVSNLNYTINLIKTTEGYPNNNIGLPTVKHVFFS